MSHTNAEAAALNSDQRAIVKALTGSTAWCNWEAIPGETTYLRDDITTLMQRCILDSTRRLGTTYVRLSHYGRAVETELRKIEAEGA